MVVPLPSKQEAGVRFPLSAHFITRVYRCFLLNKMLMLLLPQELLLDFGKKQF